MKVFYATLTNEDYHRVKNIIGAQSINQWMRELINEELLDLDELPLATPKRGYPLKTHCKQGHEFNFENTYYWKTWKQCKICSRLRNKNWRKRNALRKLHNKVS